MTLMLMLRHPIAIAWLAAPLLERLLPGLEPSLLQHLLHPPQRLHRRIELHKQQREQ